MRIILLTAIILIGSQAWATTLFEQVVGGPGLDRGVFVSPTTDGGYITIGVTKSFGEGEEDIYLVKFDAKGEKVWARTFGGPQPDFGWSVREVGDGYVLAGHTRSFGSGEYDFYLIKTNPQGESLWSKTYGGEGRDRCWAMALTGDGGFVLAGETESEGAGQEDFYLVKTDSLGTVQWTNTYGWH